ncbi:MAG: penicillin-binding protein 2, partial [Vibrio sp.]
MRHQHSPIRDHQAETQLFRNRAIVSFLAILLCMGLLVTNLYHIQINQYQDYKTRSNDNRIKVVPISPNRGLIFDRNGVLLAENRPVFNLELTPEKVPNMTETIERLQQILEISPEALAAFEKERRQTRRFNSVPLLTQLTDEQVAKFSVNQHKFPGVAVSANLKRYYPYGEVLTHVIGYVSRINDKDLERLEREDKKANYQATRDIGKLGIERYYEDLLHGTAGYQEVEVNSRGRVIRTLKYVPPIPGQDIVLNLDIELQLYAYQLLDGRRGSVVALDPQDNGVLAMVSSPSYNPNSF